MAGAVPAWVNTLVQNIENSLGVDFSPIARNELVNQIEEQANGTVTRGDFINNLAETVFSNGTFAAGGMTQELVSLSLAPMVDGAIAAGNVVPAVQFLQDHRLTLL